jgi:hypothetical protein
MAAVVTMNEVMDAILTHLDKNRGFATNTDDLHLETSKQVGDFFLNFNDILNELVENKLIKKNVFSISDKRYIYSYEILPKGSVFLESGGYDKAAKDKIDIDKLTKDKLMVDVANAENVFKSFPRTQFFAMAGFAIALFLLLLKVAEALKLWPYNR